MRGAVLDKLARAAAWFLTAAAGVHLWAADAYWRDLPALCAVYEGAPDRADDLRLKAALWLALAALLFLAALSAGAAAAYHVWKDRETKTGAAPDDRETEAK